MTLKTLLTTSAIAGVLVLAGCGDDEVAVDNTDVTDQPAVVLETPPAGEQTETVVETETTTDSQQLEETARQAGDELRDAADAAGQAIQEGAQATGDALESAADATGEAIRDAAQGTDAEITTRTVPIEPIEGQSTATTTVEPEAGQSDTLTLPPQQ